MALKPPDLLNHLPSAAELLDKPPIRALMDRWNRSSVAAGVRSFLTELQTDLQRRAGELPSLRDIAERAARYVASRQHHSLGVAINATGRLWGDAWTSQPLAEIALERTVAWGREFAMAAPSAGDGMTADLARLLCRLTGAQAAAVVNSYESALCLTLSAIAADREVLVGHRGLPGGNDSIPRLAAAARVLLKGIGDNTQPSGVDYAASVSTHTAAILVTGDASQSAQHAAAASLAELTSLAHNRGLLLVDALGPAPLVNPPEAIAWPQRSAQASLAAGADLAILRGEGMTNGPSCGILLGRREAIDRIRDQPLFAASQLDALRTVALLATIECYDRSSLGADSLPIWMCLSTALANLQNRAERLAAQLSHVESVASSIAVETRSPLAQEVVAEGWPSYGVALTPKNGDVSSLDNQLRAASHPICGRIEGERLMLDLRTVIPRQDKQVVDVLLGPSPTSITP